MQDSMFIQTVLQVPVQAGTEKQAFLSRNPA